MYLKSEIPLQELAFDARFPQGDLTIERNFSKAAAVMETAEFPRLADWTHRKKFRIHESRARGLQF